MNNLVQTGYQNQTQGGAPRARHRLRLEEAHLQRAQHPLDVARILRASGQHVAASAAPSRSDLIKVVKLGARRVVNLARVDRGLHE